MNGLHANICVLRIGTVQAERVYIFIEWNGIESQTFMSS